jgi:hypothetical protein
MDNYAQGAAYLGRLCTPFMVGGDPSRSDFRVQNIGLDQEMATRLDDRNRLLHGIDALRRRLDKERSLSTMDSLYQQACSLFTCAEARKAFRFPGTIQGACIAQPLVLVLTCFHCRSRG